MERSIREAEANRNPDLIDTDKFWDCWLCRKISYDIFHSTFILGMNFSIDTALQNILLNGFYLMFPEYPKSLKPLTKPQVKKKEKLLAFWRFLFLNSCAAIRDRKAAISLSFTRSHYNIGGPYHCEYWSYTELQAVTKKAVQVGYFRKFKGRKRTDGDSYITRLEILDGFTTLIDDYIHRARLSGDIYLPDELTWHDFILQTPLPKPGKPPLVIKQDDDKRTAPSLNNRSVKQIHDRVVAYNEFMQRQEIVVLVDTEDTDAEHLKTLVHAVTRREIELLNTETIFNIKKQDTPLQILVPRCKHLRTIKSNKTVLLYSCTDTDNNTDTSPREHNLRAHQRHKATHQLYPANNCDLLYDYSELLVPNSTDLLFLQTRFQCFRSFNGDMKHGGRFYGIINQQLPSEIRVRTLINGSSVVELDYKSLHPSLLYSSLGIHPPEDIYIADGRLRSLYKTIALVGFNASDERKALGAIRKECKESFGYMLKDDEIRAGLNEFFSHNPKLRQFYLKGVGLELQWQDSQIMDWVLTRLRKEDVPAIPVHDSVIVPIESAVKAEEAMVSAYQHVTGTHHIPHITEEVNSSWKRES